MTTLSYSTINALIHCPHTWINKISGLKTYSLPIFEQGKEIHQIIQESVSGDTPHSLLVNLPHFPLVETEDFDPKMKFVKPFNDNYSVVGFIDGKNPDTREFLEIKSGRPWSVRDFYNLEQWRIYAWALGYKKVWFVNTPISVEKWCEANIKVYNKEIAPDDIAKAEKYIHSAIDVIEHIHEHVKDLKPQPRNRYCYYEGCPYCID